MPITESSGNVFADIDLPYEAKALEIYDIAHSVTTSQDAIKVIAEVLRGMLSPERTPPSA